MDGCASTHWSLQYLSRSDDPRTITSRPGVASPQRRGPSRWDFSLAGFGFSREDARDRHWRVASSYGCARWLWECCCACSSAKGRPLRSSRSHSASSAHSCSVRDVSRCQFARAYRVGIRRRRSRGRRSLEVPGAGPRRPSRVRPARPCRRARRESFRTFRQ
jgi:hypothetical protein